MTDQRDKISARIRALRAKTVENGCTEAEALAAAELLARLLEKYNFTIDEAELRETPFTRHTETHDDWVGDRLWKVADGIAYLTGARYWVSGPGVRPIEINFFGFAHEVEVAGYLLEICAAAMRRDVQAKVLNLMRDSSGESRRRRAAAPFLDGMADRLRQRLRALKPPGPAGTGLILLHDALVEQAMDDLNLHIKSGGHRVSRDRDAGYALGRAAGDRVALNPGLANNQRERRLLR